MASAFRHEDAFRQECLLAAVLIPAALLIPVGGTERALMIASVLLVLIVELLNSAVGSRGRQDFPGKSPPREAGEGIAAPRYS